MFLFSEICEEVIDFFKPNFSKKNITVENSFNDKLVLYADKKMIKTILRNLISNAIKFTNEGGMINIRAEQDSKEVIISVSDNGIGISPENISKLLDNSHTYTTTGTALEQGSGLGLILCKEFIEKHGGKLLIDSEPIKGSTFKITLPVFSK